MDERSIATAWPAPISRELLLEKFLSFRPAISRQCLAQAGAQGGSRIAAMLAQTLRRRAAAALLPAQLGALETSTASGSASRGGGDSSSAAGPSTSGRSSADASYASYHPRRGFWASQAPCQRQGMDLSWLGLKSLVVDDAAHRALVQQGKGAGAGCCRAGVQAGAGGTRMRQDGCGDQHLACLSSHLRLFAALKERLEGGCKSAEDALSPLTPCPAPLLQPSETASSASASAAAGACTRIS